MPNDNNKKVLVLSRDSNPIEAKNKQTQAWQSLESSSTTISFLLQHQTISLNFTVRPSGLQ